MGLSNSQREILLNQQKLNNYINDLIPISNVYEYSVIEKVYKKTIEETKKINLKTKKSKKKEDVILDKIETDTIDSELEETIKSVKEKNEDLLQNSDLLESDNTSDNDIDLFENDDDKDVSISQDIDKLNDSLDEDTDEDTDENVEETDKPSDKPSEKDNVNISDKEESVKDISDKEESVKETSKKDNLDLMFFGVVDNIKKSENKEKPVKNTHKPNLTDFKSVKDINISDKDSNKNNDDNDKSGGYFSKSNIKNIKLTEKYDFF